MIAWTKNIIPPRRHDLTWILALPLLIFGMVYLGICLYLDLSSTLLFSRPTAFWLCIVLPWIWWVHVQGYHGLSRTRGHMALFTRFAIAGALIMVLAEPRAVRTSDILSLMYVVDTSDSISETAVDDALKYVTSTVTEKPEKDQAGLIVFGRNAAVELPPRVSFPFEAINVRVTKDGTDLAKSLSLAEAMLPDENQGRIVLISDGTETEGRVTDMLDALKSKDISVDVLPITYEYQKEVWLEKLELPRTVKMGETYEASIVLSSMSDGAGKLVLMENDDIIFDKQVIFKKGKNRFTVPIYLRQSGYYEYTARIQTPSGNDGWEENNVAVADLFLKGKGKVLFITSPSGDPRDAENMITALKESKRLVETLASYEFPRDAISLLPYDCVIMANVPAEDLDAAQQTAIRDAVYQQGLGFLMVGGENSFGPGGFHRTPIEEALPVSMDVKQKKIMPKGALAIVLHTCEFANGNTWGKNIAKEAIKVLGAQDDAGILVYDWQGGGNNEGVRWLFPLTPVSEYDQMVPKINGATIGDMPSFAPTMKMALDALKASDAAMKHIIIISDGDPQPPPPGVIQSFKDNKISISTISIFPHGNREQMIMRTLANQTGGRYYYPKDPRQLPGIFIKEAKTLKRSMIQNKVFVPTVGFPSPILKGVGSAPNLHGYVITTIKPMANNVLNHVYEEEDDPILATWRFGLGKAAAFTSDLSVNWGKDWTEWEQYRAFINQLVTDISRVKKDSHLNLQAYADGGTGVIVIEDYHTDPSFLEFSTEVSGPNNRPQSVKMKQVGPNLYRGEFPLEGQGRYQILAAAAGADRNEQIIGGLAVPYSPEYLRFRSNPNSLRKIADRTNGRVLAGNEAGTEIFGIDRNPRQSSRPIFDWFLWSLAFLIPIDVGIRRIQIDLFSIKKWLGLNKSEDSTATMNALLKRKEHISQNLDERREDQPSRVMTNKTNRPSSTFRPSTHNDDTRQTTEVDTDETTTTGRLLALKKKREEHQDD